MRAVGGLKPRAASLKRTRSGPAAMVTDLENWQTSRKPPISRGLSFVAGAGFEPATFGL